MTRSGQAEPTKQMGSREFIPQVKGAFGGRGLLSLIVVLSLLIGIIFSTFSRTGNAQEIMFPDIESEAALLMEFSRGEVIYARGEKTPRPPASLTKIMTLLLVYEALQEGRADWNDEIIISEEAWRTGGSQMYLEIDQAVPLSELVAGIATVSANDACVAVAEYLSGSESNFVAEMNRRAGELGLTNTLFQNTSGLPDENHYSSALDMARLAHYYISHFPEALALHSQREFTFNSILQYNRNPLLGNFPGADGLKTGHTNAAGHCLISTVEQKGMRFIAVIMNAPSPAVRQRESEMLFNFAFRNYSRHHVFSPGEEVVVAEIHKGTKRRIALQVEKALEVVIPFNRQDDLRIDVDYPQNITAPVGEQEPLGSVAVFLDDQLLDSTPLVAAESVEKAGFFTLLRRSLADFTAGVWSRFVSWVGGILPAKKAPV